MASSGAYPNVQAYLVAALSEGGFIVTPQAPSYRGDMQGWPTAAFTELDAALAFIRSKLCEDADRSAQASKVEAV